MSPYGTIYTTYRAEVCVPTEVFEAFGHTPEYEQFSSSVAKQVATSGRDAYSDVIEWGESCSYYECEIFITDWHNKILQWQQQLRETR